MSKSPRPQDAAAKRVRGRSPEFRIFLAELQVTDPALYRLIVAAEAAFVPEHEARLAHEEAILAEQMEGYADTDDGS